MKIAFIEETSELGGAQYNNLLLQKYKPSQFESVVFLPDKGKMYTELEKLGINIYQYKRGKHFSFSFYIGSRKFVNPFALVWLIIELIQTTISVKRALKGQEVSLVVTNGMMAHLFGGIAAKINGVRAVWRLEDIVSKSHSFGMGYKMFRYFAKILPSQIIVPSNAVRRLNFGSRYDSSEFVKTIYNSAETDEFSPETPKTLRNELKISSETILVGITSRLTQWKGHIQFIEAAEKALQANNKLVFIIIGGALFGNTSSYETRLKSMIEKKGLLDNVLVTGFRRDIAACMNSLDIVVLPSILPDPCPRVMFECMALKKPIIGSDQGGIPEVVKDGVSGIIINPFNMEEFSNAILKLASNNSLREIMGDKGYEILNRDFSLSKYTQTHFEVFGANILS